MLTEGLAKQEDAQVLFTHWLMLLRKIQACSLPRCRCAMGQEHTTSIFSSIRCEPILLSVEHRRTSVPSIARLTSDCYPNIVTIVISTLWSLKAKSTCTTMSIRQYTPKLSNEMAATPLDGTSLHGQSHWTTTSALERASPQLSYPAQLPDQASSRTPAQQPT